MRETAARMVERSMVAVEWMLKRGCRCLSGLDWEMVSKWTEIEMEGCMDEMERLGVKGRMYAGCRDAMYLFHEICD